MRGFITAFAKNNVFANIVLLIIFIAGGIALKSMVRESFPEFSLDMIQIMVTYPGADPEEVEEGVSLKIEEAIEGLEGIKLYTTESYEGVSSTIIEVKQNYKVKDVLDRVETEINAISTFPLDAERPVVKELILKDMVLILYLTGDLSERGLKEWAEDVKDEIRKLDNVSQVSIFGARDYEINIEVSEKKLQEYGITFNDVTRAIRQSNLDLAGGNIRTKGEDIRIRTMGKKYHGEDLAGIVVLSGKDGELITLDKLADIKDNFNEDPVKATINGSPSIFVMVMKTKEEDSLTISRAVHKYVEMKNKELPPGALIKVAMDNTDILESRIDLLIRNGIMGLALVFFMLWLFLDVRLSFWVGMGIPTSIAGAIALLWAFGGTLNMVSLFGFIMVLGIIVDDAIVVGEAVYVHRQSGESGLMASVEGLMEVGMPIIAAVTTTIVAFLPLMFLNGIMGKFIAILPFVVIACLTISLVECLILLPAHLNHLPIINGTQVRGNVISRSVEKIRRKVSFGMEWFALRVYAPFLNKAMEWRYICFCTAMAILLLAIGLVQGGIIKYEMFGSVDGFIVTAHVEFPNGTPPKITEQAVKKIENAFMEATEGMKTITGEPLIKDMLALVGQTIEEIPQHGPNYGSVQVILLESEKRGIHTDDLISAWEKQTGEIPGMKSLKFQGMDSGPPGAPIEVWLEGDHMEDIIAASEDLMMRLKKFDGVFQVRSDFSMGKNEIRLKLKPEARTLGITVSDLAGQIYAGYYGEEAMRIQRGRDDVRIKVRYTEKERQDVAVLTDVRIRTPKGFEVPLMSVADVTYAPGYSKITRTDGLRRIAVSADVNTRKANTNEVFQELQTSYFSKLKRKFPGVYVEIQGEQKKTRESIGSLVVGFPLAIVGMFIIIATMFRSYIQPFIIMFTIPFGIIGGILGHMLLGFNLSLMSVFGFVALAGVVVNDAIVLIERVNENLAEGMNFKEAIRNGGARRFRAIFLTSITTVGGLMPLILETDLQARFLIPMAISIAAGVAFATVLTLVLIPSLLVIMNDFRRLYCRINNGYWPDREEVEPAASRKKELYFTNDTPVKKDA